MRVLIVEDNVKLAESIKRGLEELGHLTTIAQSKAEARNLLADVDAIVLDLMLPDGDGLELCRWFRMHGHRIPVLILSALSSTRDKVAGLEAGADDYLAKPFELDELISRLRAIVRRYQGAPEGTLRHADIELDVSKRIARRAGQSIVLTNREFTLLEFFMRSPEEVLTRAQIGERVWALKFDPGSNVIDVYVSALRRKIDRGFARPLVHTIVGVGYFFGVEPPDEQRIRSAIK